MNRTYSTAELARLLSVNESTVKRWSDSGDLPCVKTKGGHRRFAVASVMKFIQHNQLTTSAAALESISNEDLRAHVVAGNIHKLLPELKQEMLAGNDQGILRILRIASVARPDLLDLFSELVFPPLAEIGDAWQSKKISIDQEHLATNALREALSQFHAELHRKPSNGLKALCACPGDEWHDVTIRCVAYFLETEGWNVLYLGQSSPIPSLVRAIKTHRPNLVALSVMTRSGDRSMMNAVNHHIYPAAHRVKARLAVGGPAVKAQWEGKVKSDILCDTIGECRSFADPKQYSSQHGA